MDEQATIITNDIMADSGLNLVKYVHTFFIGNHYWSARTVLFTIA